MFKNLKLKIYNKVANKYKSAIKVYARYKLFNKNLHESNKLRSKMYLLRLIKAQNKEQNLYDVKLPKNAINPYSLNLSNSNCDSAKESDIVSHKSPEDLASHLAQFDVVSFDIFDTCLFRPFSKPEDLFYILECETGIFNFKDFRILAEKKAREKSEKSEKEINLQDIYDEFKNICKSNKINQALELELEKKLCYANPYMLKVFNLLKEKKTKLIATSDMYLSSKELKKLLESKGFIGFENIFVSNEHGATKASGRLFEIVKNAYPNGTKFVHVGDNEVSDIANGSNSGFEVVYYPNCNELGKERRPEILISPTSSLCNGIINNHIYCGLNNQTAREQFTFINAGILVSGFCEWINEFSKQNGIDKIIFLARDMDIFYKVYNKHYKMFDSEYAIVSRFALQEAIFEDYPGEFFIHNIKVRSNKGYTIKQAFSEVNLESLSEKCSKFDLNESDFITDENIDKIEKLFNENIKDIEKNYTNQHEACKQYFKTIVGKSKNVCIVDLGWRGSNIAYLKHMLVDKWNFCNNVKGVLIGNTISNASINMVSNGLITPYVYNHILNRNYLKSNDAVMEYINVLLLEAIFTSEEPSLIEFKLNEKTKKPEFLTYEDNPNKNIIKEFQNGIMSFVDEFESVRKHYKNIFPISPVDAFEPIYSISENSKLVADIIGDIVDTPFCIAGIGINNRDYVSLREQMLERGIIDSWDKK